MKLKNEDLLLEYDDFEVVSLGKQFIDVYDLEVEKNHNFFANDILVHNSTYVNLESLVNKLFAKELTNTTKIVDFIDKFVEEKLTPHINKRFAEFADYVNANSNKISFKRESICDSAVFCAKKKYMLNVYDNEGVRYHEPKVKVTGLQSQTSSTPEICRTAIKETYKLILTKSRDDVLDYMETFKKEFLKKSPVEIAFNRGVKGLAQYSSAATIYSKGTPIHVRGSLLYNHYIKKLKLDKKYPLINEGDKIKFLYLKVPNNIRENVIAFPTNIPKEFDIIQSIDYNTQYSKTYEEPIKDIFNILGWSTEETLESLFC